MKFINFSQDELFSFLFESPLNEIKEGVVEFSPQLLTNSVLLLQSQDLFDSIQRLIAIIQATDESQRLEAIGKGISLKQFLEILTAFSEHQMDMGKLSPMLVGLTPLIFQQALHKIEPHQLAILKLDSLSEPLQHQLTVFTHAFEKLNHDLETYITELYGKINTLKDEDLTSSILDQLEKRFYELKKSFQEHINAINNALAITWTTNRLDLIKNLNQLKDNFSYLSNSQIGFKSNENQPSTGLFEALDEYLKNIFSSDSPTQPIGNKLDDDDAAIEGLAKFSIWYLQDYWAVGLLPSIPDATKLELDPKKNNEQERFDYRQYLLGLVQWNLVRLGLTKVSDLKKNRIFSKQMLKEFILKNQNKLLED